ncbi:MAG: aminoacyl-tRNA hydrolase [Bacteroidales bacterium]|nr:aminoacyl-tRNA hydrolase [Bacteroidales bacterium]MCK4408025.1 aminoacyl-tRNA hydrolase [Bacteroidales bacterium]MCK4638974.1 aminoacyl-tRNA hydrolase [Bacteroidales bacterium]
MKYLIVGLGNIGEEYANTRHNIGFIVLDALALNARVKFSSARYASLSKMKFKGRTFVLIKPTTYMNLSGKAVKYWLTKEKIPIENLLVILDDIALPLGFLRMKKKGGDAGHNGLVSIIERLGTTEFPRLRIGIGDDFALGYQSEYVLNRWTKTEEKIMIPRIEIAVEMIKNFATIGIELTMTTYNNK